MSKETIGRIQLISRLLLSLRLVVAGILLMAACVSIYRIGDRPFTPENIGSAFAKIQVPIYITLGVLFAVIVLHLVYPRDKQKTKAAVNQEVVLARLMKRLDVGACDPSLLQEINGEKQLRKLLRIATLVLSAVASIPALVHVLNFSNFGADYNQSVIAACLWVLPCSFFVLGLCIALIYIEEASIKRQMVAVKACLAASKGGTATPADAAKKENTRLVLGIRIALLAIAAVLIVLGIVNGGMADVLSKAINICTECIGLG